MSAASEARMRMEVKVGALVLFSLVLLAGFILVLGDFSLGSQFEFQVEFDNAGGLKPGADVAIAGLNVGNVKELSFVQKKEKVAGDNIVSVRARLEVEPTYAESIRKESEFFITTRGVLGEPYIEIVTESYASARVEAGDVIRGIDPPRIDLIIAKATELITALTDLLNDPDVVLKEFLANTSELVKSLNGVLKDNRGEIDGVLGNANESLKQAAILLTALNAGVGDGTSIRAMVGNLEGASQDVRVAARNARSISAEVDGKVGPLLGQVDETLTQAGDVAKAANRLVAQNEEKIAKTIDNVYVSTESLKKTSEDAQVMVQGIKKGEGTVGGLLTDREIYDDLRELMRQIKQKPWKILWKE